MAQLALSLFTLVGLHYLFRLPVEPRANWISRVYEPGHSTLLLSGVERFMLYGGVAPVTLLSLGLFIFVINGLMFLLAAKLLDGFVVDSFMAGVIGSTLYSVISWLLTRLLPGSSKS